MDTETKDLVHQCLESIDESMFKHELRRILSQNSSGEVLTIIANEGVHPRSAVHDRGCVYIASKGNLDFSSQERIHEEFESILLGVARKLKSKLWKQVYLVPFGPAILSMQIKLLVYRILNIETVDVLHAGNGIYYDVQLSQRQIAIKSEQVM